MVQIPDIIVTTIYVLITLSIAEICRIVIGFVFKNQYSKFFHLCCQEFIASFELCAVCYEICFALDYSIGEFLYGVYLFGASLWWCLRWKDASSAPYTYIVEWVAGSIDLRQLAILIFSQMSGGVMFYRFYLEYFWSLGYGAGHVEKLGLPICHSDLQASIFAGAFTETFGLFVILLVGNILETFTLPELYKGIVNALVSTVLVVSALDISGGYYNPVLATALQIGCFDATASEHFFVYWIGSTVGALITHWVWTYTKFRNLFPKKVDEKLD